VKKGLKNGDKMNDEEMAKRGEGGQSPKKTKDALNKISFLQRRAFEEVYKKKRHEGALYLGRPG